MINICNNLFVFWRYFLNKYLIIYETDFPIFEGFKDWEFLNIDMSGVFTRFFFGKVIQTITSCFKNMASKFRKLFVHDVSYINTH